MPRRMVLVFMLSRRCGLATTVQIRTTLLPGSARTGWTSVTLDVDQSVVVNMKLGLSSAGETVRSGEHCLAD